MFGSTLHSSKKYPKKTLRHPSASTEILCLLNDVSICTRAPSIPARNQTSGYEVGKSGKLILQDTPVMGFKGTKGDTVGPGDYDPDHGYILKNKTTANFAVSVVYSMYVYNLCIKLNLDSLNVYLL